MRILFLIFDIKLNCVTVSHLLHVLLTHLMIPLILLLRMPL
ncbi:hypothetical protein F383_35765 [Gossypium arboreum]|uniref:Uncharacterized protein n=1 Tax=Gossypium arboreum TaxID=29729 RepID=A0A0B0Q031_GOSAR|nr:hypothetical protein F383_35765 [Gossypium arboreum]